MAKKKAAPKSKRTTPETQAIRDYLGDDVSIPPKQVIEAVAKKGYTITPKQVSNTKQAIKNELAKKQGNKKSTAKKEGPVKKAAAPKKKKAVSGKKKSSAKSAAPSAAATAAVAMPSTEELFEAKKLVAALGGFDQAEAALNTLKDLQD